MIDSAHRRITLDMAMLLSLPYVFLCRKCLCCSTWNSLRCNARHSAEARHSVPGALDMLWGLSKK